jgi:hypothetical protein
MKYAPSPNSKPVSTLHLITFLTNPPWRPSSACGVLVDLIIGVGDGRKELARKHFVRFQIKRDEASTATTAVGIIVGFALKVLRGIGIVAMQQVVDFSVRHSGRHL